MNPEEDRSGIMDLVHGDAASARDLRANLAVFARRSNSPQMHRLVSEVLAGRRNVRDVLRSEEFNDAGTKRLANAEKGIAQLTDEQRAELFDPDRSGLLRRHSTRCVIGTRRHLGTAARRPGTTMPTSRRVRSTNRDRQTEML
jgi:hypothetical protein